MKTIFISYSRKDAAWKDRLLSHLKVLEDQGLCRLWHDRHIEPGQEWYPEIDRALNQAHMAIMLITKNFLESGFIKTEEIPRILARREKEELMAVPLFVMPCAWNQVDWLKGILGFPFDGQVVAEGSDVDIEKRLAEFTDMIAGCLKNKTGENPFDRPGPTPAPAPRPHRCKTLLFTRLPYRKIDLIGREMELTEIDERLQRTRRVLLVNGLGGIGKTEVCKTFFLEHYRRYAYAGWIDWTSSLAESVIDAFSFEVPGLGLGETATLEEQYKKIMGFLQRLEEPALLVFDNIEDPGDEQLQDLTGLPENIKVIANSRSDLPGFDGWKLEVLSENRCRELFYRYYDMERDDEGVDAVVGRCGRHTLTIELLARTARNAALRVRDLERLLAEKGFNLNEVIKDKVNTFWHDINGRKPFFDHLMTIFDLSGVTAEELAFMVNLAVLPAIYIPLAELKEWLGLEDQEVVGSLVSKGWLRREEGKIYMHPVVQEVTRYRAPPGVKDCERLIESLTGKLHVEPGENPLDKQGYVVYAATLLQYIVEPHEKAATLANNLSTIYQALGQLEKALEFQLKTLEIKEKVLAKNHPDLAASYHNLSLIYRDMTEFPTARTYAQKAVEIWQSLFPNGHPNLDKALRNLEALKGRER